MAGVGDVYECGGLGGVVAGLVGWGGGCFGKAAGEEGEVRILKNIELC